ncbi:hypothetical protein [Algoriphagus litoralis]|uniref:hypothetical protein n=1 Tax=Algoriphagus litoralis TaxID=2202829 RepID=UPI000DBA3509|nr:hypothetical protein [Algoriphagus litoralis]
MLLALSSSQTPPIRLWDLFSTTKFTEKLNKKIGLYFFYPNFNEELKALEGKTVELRGFFIPLDIQQKSTIILSKYPMAECFFCGGSGPESVAVAHLKNLPSRKLKMDQIITVRGILQLNAEDVEEMTFIINQAEIIN